MQKKLNGISDLAKIVAVVVDMVPVLQELQTEVTASHRSKSLLISRFMVFHSSEG